MMATTHRIRYVVRLGSAPGKGKYARVTGCDCPACINWVDDRDDATKYVFREHPDEIAHRNMGRVVRVVKAIRYQVRRPETAIHETKKETSK